MVTIKWAKKRTEILMNNSTRSGDETTNGDFVCFCFVFVFIFSNRFCGGIR